MADRTELTFRRHAEPLFPSGSSILVAVSGGGDSVALLHLLAHWGGPRGPAIGIAHLDHGLRSGSPRDRRFVERLGRRLDLEVHAERRDVAELRRKDESPAEAARRVRRSFLRETAGSFGYDRIALGHTLDDQAETILMRLVRGSGATALAGMSARGPGRLARPLLTLEREELRDYLRRKNIEWREDPSNDDLSFDRNRLRHRILPVLSEELNPRAARHLVRAARLMREDAAHLDDLAQHRLDDLSRLDHRGRLVLDARGLAELAPPIAQRLARLALARAGVDGRRVATRHVDGLLDLARGGRGRQLDFPSGVRARREIRHLWIGR